MRKQLLLLAILGVILYLPAVLAIDYNQTITPEQQAMFDQALSPLARFYLFFKYAVSFVGVIALAWSGSIYMISGSDPKKRESAKYMACGVLVGLAIMWAAPFVVQFISG